MKKNLLFLTFLPLFVLTTFAKQVDENTAKLVGQNFLSTKSNSTNLISENSF